MRASLTPCRNLFLQKYKSLSTPLPLKCTADRMFVCLTQIGKSLISFGASFLRFHKFQSSKMSLVPDYESSDEEPTQASIAPPAKRKIQIVVDLPHVDVEASLPKKVLKMGSGLFAALPAPKSNQKPLALGGGSKGASITLKPISQKTYQAPVPVIVSESNSKKSQKVDDDSFFSLPEAETFAKLETSVPIKIKPVVVHLPEEAESASAAYVYPQKDVEGSSTYMYPEADSQYSYLPADIDLHEVRVSAHSSQNSFIN